MRKTFNTKSNYERIYHKYPEDTPTKTDSYWCLLKSGEKELIWYYPEKEDIYMDFWKGPGFYRENGRGFIDSIYRPVFCNDVVGWYEFVWYKEKIK